MTTDVPAALVVVDTNVFSQVFVKVAGPERRELCDRLVGRIIVIATQTQAELRAWPRLCGWGAGRTRRLEEIVAATTVVPVTPEVVDAYVMLQVDGQKAGHPLAAAAHTADRWIAATAVALDRPLVSLDGVFQNVPGLSLI